MPKKQPDYSRTLYLVSAQEADLELEACKVAHLARRERALAEIEYIDTRLQDDSMTPRQRKAWQETRQEYAWALEPIQWRKPMTYWKVGVTYKKDPIKRDPVHYNEVFRAERIEQGAEDIELMVANTFRDLMRQARDAGHELPFCPGRESMSSAYALDDVLHIYDFWLDVARRSQRASDLLPGSDDDCLISNCLSSTYGFINLFQVCSAVWHTKTRSWKDAEEILKPRYWGVGDFRENKDECIAVFNDLIHPLYEESCALVEALLPIRPMQTVMASKPATEPMWV